MIKSEPPALPSCCVSTHSLTAIAAYTVEFNMPATPAIFGREWHTQAAALVYQWRRSRLPIRYDQKIPSYHLDERETSRQRLKICSKSSSTGDHGQIPGRIPADSDKHGVREDLRCIRCRVTFFLPLQTRAQYGKARYFSKYRCGAGSSLYESWWRIRPGSGSLHVSKWLLHCTVAVGGTRARYGGQIRQK